MTEALHSVQTLLQHDATRHATPTAASLKERLQEIDDLIAAGVQITPEEKSRLRMNILSDSFRR